MNTYLRENLDDIKHVIIDVRDNPGGDSTAFEKILQALNIKAGNFGGITRVSDIATKFYPYLNSMEYKEFERYNDVVKNENSFSSAQWVATLVKDGELGTLLGKPSRNRPTSFGNAPSFELAKTKLMGQISITKWLRPDASKDQEETIEPDIIVEDWQDPLEKTLKLIENKEDLSNM
ncbi:S41 family peptidase [Paraclostridium sordellii]|uniref:S41 family peptidase n=1 Tax=Paraclostridium sordellii TaxID=1505 RepID=UPI0021BB5AD9|nr:S41 family peptidase [Paeniclostridium sordellii]